MHDDLNMHFKAGPNKMLKSIKDSTNFDEVKKSFIENYENNNKSEITELFKGYTYSTLKCLNCEAKYYNFDMHLTFPLPVPAANSSISIHFINP
jgi:ubiquitin C-terminal hydrolase